MIARRITALVIIGSIWLAFAKGLAAPVPKLDVVKWATDASKASAEAIRSGAGVVAFESYVQEPEAMEARLWAKGKVNVYFKDEKYHFRFNYETKKVRTTYHDRQGNKKEEKIVEWKPDDLAIIFDGTKVQEIAFSQRIHPSGCQIGVFDTLRNTPSTVKEDLTRLWLKEVGLARDLKTVKREAIQVTGLGEGVFRLSYEVPWGPKGARVEIDVSSKANYNPTRYRVLMNNWDKVCKECSAKWKKADGVWYVAELEMTHRIRYSDKPTYLMERSVYRAERFDSNAKVDPQLFTLDCLTIPPRTRTLDHRPQEKR